MQTPFSESVRLDQWQRLSIGELAGFSGLSEAELHDLVDYGVLTPSNPAESQWVFSGDCVGRVRKASRLRNDLELDLHAMALAILLLDRIDALESTVSELRAQGRLPFRIRSDC